MTIFRPYFFNRVSKGLIVNLRSSREASRPTSSQHDCHVRWVSSANRSLKKGEAAQPEDETNHKEESSNRKRPRKSTAKTTSLRSVAAER